MTDKREITIEIKDEARAHKSITNDAQEFATRMATVLAGGEGEAIKLARWILKDEFGVTVTQLRKVYG